MWKATRNRAFAIACALVEELADFTCENTNPGVVVADRQPDPAFYEKAVKDFCEIDDAVRILDQAVARYRGWKNRRGLIGATAAVSSESQTRPPRSWYTASPTGSARPARWTGQACLLRKRPHFRIRGTRWIA